MESEKPAILMSALMPDYTWLATAGLSNPNAVMFAVLKRHKIQLFPDLGEFFMWWKKVDELKKPDLRCAFPAFYKVTLNWRTCMLDLTWRIILSGGIWSLDGR